jgi:hypothetical protein
MFYLPRTLLLALRIHFYFSSTLQEGQAGEIRGTLKQATLFRILEEQWLKKIAHFFPAIDY